MRKFAGVPKFCLALCWLAGQAGGAATGYLYTGDLIKDKDPTPRGSAKISGKITPPEKVVKVLALKRNKHKLVGRGKVYSQLTAFPAFPAKFDRKTGEFTVAGLKNGRYDLVVMVPGGRIEGYHFYLQRDFRRDRPLTANNRKQLAKAFDSLVKVDTFCNKLRPLGYGGNGEFVNALVEKARTREFHSDKGEAIWRIESWVMVNYTGSWKHHQIGTLVYYRKRMKKGDFRDLLWLFDPKLGGIRIRGGRDVEGFVYDIPQQWDRGLGKTPGYIFDEPLQ